MDIDTPHLKYAIDTHLANKKLIYLLQIGANDGVSHDPIYEIILSNNKIISYFIEPQKEAFLRLQENYKNIIGIRAFLFNYAIFEENKKIKLYKNLYGTDGHSSLLLRQNDSTTNFQDDVYEWVDAITFNKLIKDNNIKDIDIVIIDTEGYDSSIVTQILKSDKRPKIIFFEKPNPNANDDRLMQVSTGIEVLEKTSSLLQENNYDVFVLTGNVLAIRK